MHAQHASPSGQTPRELAQAWVDALGAVSRNLLDFRSCEACEAARSRLRADHPQALTGLSRDQARQAIAELDRLLVDYLPLSQVVEQAREIAFKPRLFGHDGGEVASLLSGHSVRLGASSEQDPSQRDLAQGALPEERSTPQAALQSMRERFAHARDRIVEVHQALLQAQSMGLGPQEIADPLAALMGARALEQDATEAARAREAFERRTQQVYAGIMALRASRARAAMALEQARAKIAGYQPARKAREGEIEFFEQWRARVFDAQRERPQAASVGLGKLIEALREARAKVDQDAQANRAPLDALESRKAAFDAHRAKAKAMRLRGLDLGAALTELEEAARGALKQEPADLSLIDKLVPPYCAAVAALGS